MLLAAAQIPQYSIKWPLANRMKTAVPCSPFASTTLHWEPFLISERISDQYIPSIAGAKGRWSSAGAASRCSIPSGDSLLQQQQQHLQTSSTQQHAIIQHTKLVTMTVITTRLTESIPANAGA